MDPEYYNLFENDCLTELGNREAWEDSHDETEWNNNEPDCGDENDIDERPLPDSDEDIIALMDENDVMEKIIERLTKERDQARREVCVILNGNMKQAHEYAAGRDWDCFKEDTQ